MVELTDNLKWYRAPVDDGLVASLFDEPEFILDEEPGFMQDNMMRLLVNDDQYSQEEIYQIDIDDSTSMQASKFKLEGHLFYHLELNSKTEDLAILTYAPATDEINRSTTNIGQFNIYNHLFDADGLPDDYKDAFKTMLLDPEHQYTPVQDSLEHRIN